MIVLCSLFGNSLLTVVPLELLLGKTLLPCASGVVVLDVGYRAQTNSGQHYSGLERGVQQSIAHIRIDMSSDNSKGRIGSFRVVMCFRF